MRTTTTTTTTAMGSALVQKISVAQVKMASAFFTSSGRAFFFSFLLLTHTHSGGPFSVAFFAVFRRTDFHEISGKRYGELLAIERLAAARISAISKRNKMVTKFPPSGCFSFSCGKGKAGCVRVRMKWQTVRANLRINLRSVVSSCVRQSLSHTGRGCKQSCHFVQVSGISLAARQRSP